MDPRSINIRITNELEEIGRLAELTTKFFAAHSLPNRLLYHFNLALDETLTNIILYAYEDQGPRTIKVKIKLNDDTVSAEVVDDGRPFDPLRHGEPDLEADIDDRALGGLGVFFVKTLMDTVEYQRCDSFNHLRFTKRAAAATSAKP